MSTLPREEDQGRAPEGLLCDYGKTLKGEHCELPGEVWLGGSLYCNKHAARIEVQDRVALLRGFISCVELCLSNITLRRNAALARLLHTEREMALVELEVARLDLRRVMG